jgi:hypothetical protein
MAGETQVVDLWPEFLNFWRESEHLPAPEQVAQWLALFAHLEPEIHARYAASMAEDGQDWTDDLLRHHWPSLSEHLPHMAEAHDCILTVYEPTAEQARMALGIDLYPVLVIIPVGYGGWATRYRGGPACDLGLDTIVELGWWERAETLAGLVAHELGHLAHYRCRREPIEYHARGPFWDIYDEGFAQVCEGLVQGEVYHLASHQPGWLQWGRAHRGMLAREFLRRVDAGEALAGFFGSYPELNIEGYREMGYFLGQEIVGAWVADEGLKSVALIPEDEAVRRVRGALEDLAAEDPS